MLKYTPTQTGFRTRINDKCRDCTYDPQDQGTWRMQVEKCTSVDCALWDVRPLSKATKKVKEIY